MIIDDPVLPFFEWIRTAGLTWLAVVGAVLVVALVTGYVVGVLRHGPIAAFGRVGRVLAKTFHDLSHTSPRRALALARLAIKESIRKKVVLGIALFLVILMFAGWFLDPGAANPERTYMSFVMTMTSYMVLLLVLFLSVFSLPSDIRLRTFFTVATKPVRASEVVLGRFLGFSAIGTALLLMMGVCSYLFVTQGLNHAHRLDMNDLTEVAASEDGETAAKTIGKTRLTNGHTHSVMIDAGGEGRVGVEHGHTHDLLREGSRYRVGAQHGTLIARVPIHGDLAFRALNGYDATKGDDVGDEWTYRSYVEGQTNAAAIWTFENLDAENFPDGLPVEMTLGVFRTHKGDVTRTILGSLSLRNPETGLSVELSVFQSKEFEPMAVVIPLKIAGEEFTSAQMISRKRYNSADGSVLFSPDQEVAAANQYLADADEFDLFKDLVADGKVEVWLRCLEHAQYFGAAQADLYIRAADASVMLNFFKGYFGIWLQMLVVTACGVVLSTFLSGPVAMVAALGVLVGGFFHTFLLDLASGQMVGGGPMEAFNKLITQTSLTVELDPGLATDVTQMADTSLQVGLRAMASVIPPLSQFNYANFVAYGYDVFPNMLLVHSATALGFLIPLYILGYLFLSNREVAK